MSLHDDVVAISQKREELLSQIQAKLPALLAEQVRTVYPMASRIEVDYEPAIANGVGLYYAHDCYVYDDNNHLLFEGNVYEIGMHENSLPNQVSLDIMPTLVLSGWYIEYKPRKKFRVIEFPVIDFPELGWV